MKKVLKIILAIVLFIFIGIQFYQPALNVDKGQVYTTDFTQFYKMPVQVKAMFQTSCYDCHANETAYPWYFKIAPVSWWLKNHINEGRRELNFSTWGDYTTKRKDKKMKESIKLVQEGEMPMWSYTLVHKDAVINEAQQKTLVDWFTSLRTGEAN